MKPPMCDFCGAETGPPDDPYEFDISTPYCSERCFILSGDDDDDDGWPTEPVE